MSSLSQKRIILGITGGIAAYKSAEITRRLQDAYLEIGNLHEPPMLDIPV